MISKDDGALPQSQRALTRAALPPLPLDGGAVLRDPTVAFHLDGTLSTARDNVVVVLHALTGSADAAGDWWRGLIGPGLALDTDEVAVLSPNLIGSCYGSSGPTSGDETFPRLTTRDQARAVAVLLEHLQIRRVRLAVGGSLGGMVALELAASFPGRVGAAVVFAAPAAQPTAAIAWGHVQRDLIAALGAPGLGLARQLAMLSYRTQRGLARRFGRRHEGAAGFAVQSWLRAHGERLQQRFEPAAYLALLDAMDSHDVGRGRGGIGERLRACGTAFTGVGIPGDLLYEDTEVQSWVSAAGGTYRVLHSDAGHDAFLVERDQVGAILRRALGEVA